MGKKNKSRAEEEIYLARSDSEKRYSWVDDIKGRFELYNPQERSERTRRKKSLVSINRIPLFLKALNKDAYEPAVVSLGLFHRRVSKPLSEIEQYKVQAVNRTVDRLPEKQQHARFLMEKVKALLPQITQSYEGNVECEEEILAWAFTLDGCFIIEILRLLTGKSEWNLDPVFNRNRVQSCQHDILSDILMLENQIPIIVLIELLEMEELLNEESARTELLRMICDGVIALVHPFSYSLQPKPEETNEEIKKREEEELKVLKHYENLAEYNHILGFFHDFVRDSRNEDQKLKDVQITIPETHRHFHRPHLRHRHEQHQLRHKKPSHYHVLRASATEMFKSGMNFRCEEGVPSSKSIRFDKKKTTLHLPTIWVTDTTEVVLRNLMAVDVCQEKELSVISQYLFLMNSLIQTEEDASFLRRKRIIENSMGTDKEVCDLFNNLSKGVNFTYADKDEFEELKMGVNDWYKGKLMTKWNETLERHPRFWKFVTVFWAVILVLGTSLPTLASVVKNIIQK